VLRGLSGKQLAPLRLVGFRLLFLSILGSSVGTFFAAIALTIDVKDRTNSGVWVGAVLVVEFLPAIFVGLALGPLLDRLQRRSLMVGADLVRVAVFCVLPFATSAAEIVALALVAGLATGFFRPAVYAGVPNLVPEDQLGPANALIQTVENLSWAAGPVLGGLLTAAAGPHAAYWINAASFLLSALFVARIPARLLQSATALTRGHWTDIKDGVRTVVRSNALLAVLIGWGIASLGGGSVSVSEVFMAKNTLHAGDFGYGLLYGGIGTGLVLGSVWSSTAIERLGSARAYGTSLALMAIGFGAAAASPDIWVAAACCVVGGAGNGTAVVCNALLVQRGAPDQMRGRALTFVMSATFTLTGISTVLAGAFIGSAGARWVWGGGAAAFAVAAVVGYALARDAVGSDVAAVEVTANP
jgi:DHA3 family macrolide efflux protein-like MFS transporter